MILHALHARGDKRRMKFNIATMRRVRKFVYNYYYREKIHRLTAISMQSSNIGFCLANIDLFTIFELIAN